MINTSCAEFYYFVKKLCIQKDLGSCNSCSNIDSSRMWKKKKRKSCSFVVYFGFCITNNIDLIKKRKEKKK